MSLAAKLSETLKICPRKIVVHETNQRRSLNDQVFKGFRDALEIPENAHWVLPSASNVSYWRNILDKKLKDVFGFTESDIHVRGDTWQVSTPKKFLQTLFRHFKVGRINQGRHPYMIGICIDGASTTKKKGAGVSVNTNHGSKDE